MGVVAFLFTTMVSAQQTPSQAFWRQNLDMINPAYVGSTGKTEINVVGFKNGWSGVADAPSTQFMSAHTSLSNRVGVGLSVMQDQVFIQRESNVFLKFSYKLPVSDTANLFLGLKAGGSYFNVDFGRLNTEDAINTGSVDKFNPNFGIGAYYKAEKYFLSLSVPRVLQAERYEEIAGETQDAADALEVIVGGGYYYKLNDKFTIIPALLTRYVDGAPIGLDLNASARFMDKFELGANYRLNTSVSALFSFEVAKLVDLGFAYEFMTSDINEFTSGGPEFLVKVKF